MTEACFGAFKIAAAVGLGLNIAGFMGWLERKQSAVMQDRIGANRASIFGLRVLGLFHPIADAIKMMTKEDFIPPKGMRAWHGLAPGLSLACSLACLAALPYGERLAWGGRTFSLQPLPLSAGALFVLAMLSLGVHGVVMAGWSSGSRYACLGGLRAAAQMVSYEVSLLVTLAAPLYLYGTLDLAEAVRWQARPLWGALPAWGIFLQPLAFLLFMTAGVAETKRAPFDLPEGEAEIVGYFVEYSGMKFGMFLTNDFIESIVLAGMATALFLGGWHLPGVDSTGLLGVGVFIAKMMALLFLLMQVRWTLPRLRFDQLLALGWKSLLPLSLANFLATAWGAYLLR